MYVRIRPKVGLKGMGAAARIAATGRVRIRPKVGLKVRTWFSLEAGI